LGERLSSEAPHIIKREVEKDMSVWLPVIAGIATKEEVEVATAQELAVWCEVATHKIKLFGGGQFG